MDGRFYEPAEQAVKHHDAGKIYHKQFGSVLHGWLLGKILDFGFGEDWKNRERREKKDDRVAEEV